MREWYRNTQGIYKTKTCIIAKITRNNENPPFEDFEKTAVKF